MKVVNLPPRLLDRDSGMMMANVRIVVGNSTHALDAALVKELVEIICTSYEDSIKELFPSGSSGHERIDAKEIKQRLKAADNPEENRVLHLAFHGEKLAGCITSAWRAPLTFRLPCHTLPPCL